jgi:hypothetical protein
MIETNSPRLSCRSTPIIEELVLVRNPTPNLIPTLGLELEPGGASPRLPCNPCMVSYVCIGGLTRSRSTLSKKWWYRYISLLSLSYIRPQEPRKEIQSSPYLLSYIETRRKGGNLKPASWNKWPCWNRKMLCT